MLTTRNRKDKLIGYILILPSLSVFSVFMFWPLLRTVYLSFFEWNMVKPVKMFVGFANYIDMFQDPLTYKIIGNTVGYILILLALNFIAPYVLSFVLSVIIKKGQNIYKKIFFLPSIISLVVGSMLYLWILNPVSGPVAIIAKMLGLTFPVWSKSEGLVLVVLSLITSWKVFGYNFIVIFAGVSGVPKEAIEAAKLDNLPMWRIFIDIVFPMSSATGFYVFIITIVQGLQYVFTPIKVITQGGPNYASSNMIYNSYHEAFTLFRTGSSSAFSIVTMVLFIILLILEFKFVEKGVYYEN
ncbi:MAG: sn-glycerol 3-phosphate transport system permease protein [Acetobacterium sp.]|nr:sn-glycerol 3-phosphate transport system permease protein [Acetobacterium sp.]